MNHDLIHAGVVMQNENTDIPIETMSAAFLLGKLHVGLVLILQSHWDNERKLKELRNLEYEIRCSIEKVYYSNHDL